MRICVKRNGEVLAACDEGLVGKRFEEKELVLDIKKSFYYGEVVGEEELSRMLAEAKNINLVGEQTINIAKRDKLVGKVGRIKGVPYAIIFKV
jgi:hypothetical protein